MEAPPIQQVDGSAHIQQTPSTQKQPVSSAHKDNPENNLLVALHQAMTEAGGVGLERPARHDRPREAGHLR
jgi:hypothetical protein